MCVRLLKGENLEPKKTLFFEVLNKYFQFGNFKEQNY